MVIEAHFLKICRGRNIGSAIAFKKGLLGCGDFKRDERRVGKSQIG
jgi:hypothetical protein